MNIDEEEWINYRNNIKKLINNNARKIFCEKSTTTSSIIEVVKNKNNHLFFKQDKITNQKIFLSSLIKDDKFDIKLRKGKFNIDAKLDLHGLTYIQAQTLLLHFINKSLQNGYKYLLVITGKGLKLDGKSGIIRQNISNWLSDINLSSKIGAFCYAKNKDGGQGAFYIRLKTTK